MLKPGCFFSVVVPVGAIWMESNHNHLHLNLIAADLLTDCLAEGLFKGFVDQEAPLW